MKIKVEDFEQSVTSIIDRVLIRKGIAAPELINARQTRELLGVSAQTILKYVQNKSLTPEPRVPLGKLYFRKNDVLEFKMVQPKYNG